MVTDRSLLDRYVYEIWQVQAVFMRLEGCLGCELHVGQWVHFRVVQRLQPRTPAIIVLMSVMVFGVFLSSVLHTITSNYYNCSSNWAGLPEQFPPMVYHHNNNTLKSLQFSSLSAAAKGESFLYWGGSKFSLLVGASMLLTGTPSSCQVAIIYCVQTLSRY